MGPRTVGLGGEREGLGEPREEAPTKFMGVTLPGPLGRAGLRAPTMAPTTKNNSNPQTKSDFIRSQPAAMSAAEIVQKAKARGIELRAGLVYEVRRMAKAKKAAPTKKTSPTKKRASGAVSTTANGTAHQRTGLSKAAFVRQFPNLSPRDIVEKAKTEHIKLDVGYVYNIRSTSKAAHKLTRARSSGSPRGADKSARPTTSTSVENLLRTVAAEIGLGRALEILASERARFRAVLVAG